MKFSLALFDLDGTLQDSEVGWIDATRRYLAENSVDIPQCEAERLVYGRSALEIYTDIASMERLKGLGKEEIAAGIREIYLEYLSDSDISIPSSVGLLKRLSGRMTVAIVSGSPKEDVVEAAKRLGIIDCVSLILGAEDCAKGKPDPEGYSKAAAILGFGPPDAVVFEDSRAGVLSAKAAGMYCVALKRPGKPDQDVSGADLILEDLSLFTLDD